MANGLFNLKQVMQAVQQSGWPAQKTPAVEYLVVAGGGGGGAYYGSGGGAGGLLAGIYSVPNSQTLLVTVGSGGAGASGAGYGVNGTASVFGQISTAGGGGGAGGSASSVKNGLSGGSGGGGQNYDAGTSVAVGGSGVLGQGNNGGPGVGGGGGGAGTAGYRPTAINLAGGGGNGTASAISGTVTAYAGGGAGAGGGQPGGFGGGGAANVAGTANTGGGGGGDSGSNGGSGIVIVSYPDVYAAASATTGSPTVSTSGSGSIAFNGSTQYLNFGNQTALHLGSGSFTVEMWLYKNANTAYMTACGDLATGSGTNTFQIVGDATGSKIAWYNSATGTFDLTSTTSLATGTWYHVAFVRNSSTLTLYINGVSDGVATLTTNYNASTSFYVGQTVELIAGRYWNGYISNFRMVKGTAVYTSNFTPSTTPLTAITNTSLLLNTVSGAYLADGSTNSFVATTVGSPAWNALSPFTGTGYKNRVYSFTSSGSITF
jgi:hypothetical protein